jgi:hypothetical protein
MFNLTDIIQSAQGGEAVQNLAQRFDLPPAQAQAAVSALIPALSAALSKRAGSPAGLTPVIASMGDDQHQASFQSPDAAHSEAGTASGAAAAGQIFGSSQVIDQIVARAAAATGLSPDLLRQMLPVLTSIVLGGLMTSLRNQGFGGIIGQLASAVTQGGLGSILGQAAGSPQTAPAPGQGGGGLGGLVGSVLGGLFGGTPAAGGQEAPSAGGLSPATMQAGLDALTKMFHPGSQGDTGLEQEIGQILGGHA